jgi:rhamnosyl/mannosyltransferase
LKVLHFYKTSFPETSGGIEQVVHQLARGSSHYGIEADVLSLTSNKAPPTMEVDGYTLHRAPLNFEIASTGFSASVLLRFVALAKKADVLHYHFPWPFMDIIHFLSRMRIKKPTVVTYHSDIIRQKNLLKLYAPLQKRFLSSMDKIIATSSNYLETSLILGCYSSKVEVIPIGLDINSYPTPTTERLSYWHKKVGDKFFLFVGVLRYYKGLHILIEAAARVNYPIIIVGAGPIEQELKQQAQQLGLSNVLFLGFLPDEDKMALLQLCYGIVFPSHLRSEAFGVSLLEGAMFSKPMISSELGTGTTFINIHGKTGLVVPPGNPEALSEALKFLWEHPIESQAMGVAASERYWNYFTGDQMIKSYAALYFDLRK